MSNTSNSLICEKYLDYELAVRELAKNLVDTVPYSAGRWLSRVPMSLRLGRDYAVYRRRAELGGECVCDADMRAGIQKMLAHAYSRITFYRNLYDSSGLDFEALRFENLASVPVVSKAMLRQYPLEQRSDPAFALKQSNTGGTTGQPLSFYVEKAAYAREWAHMHMIWESLGYRYTDEKLTVRGKNIGNRYIRYNFNQNEFLVNAYAPLEQNLAACRELVAKRNLRWIHGYPSSVFNFLQELERADASLFEVLIGKIKGVFLGSEFPAPKYRRYIENHCKLKTVSWYGHSEMAVLAPEKEPGSGVYYPFYSYGLPEAIPDGDSYRLVGTSIHNYASPFIRYDTGDLIEPTFRGGLLECFRIKEGRNSDSVIDKNGRSISLTALIFGRHHRAFDYSDHIQVKHAKKGRIEVLITSHTARRHWAELFDFSNAYFDVSYRQLDSPIVSAAGKVQLLVREG